MANKHEPTMQGASRPDDRFQGSSPKTGHDGSFIYHGDLNADSMRGYMSQPGIADKAPGLMESLKQEFCETTHYSCPMPRYRCNKEVYALEIDWAAELIESLCESGLNGERLTVIIHFTDKGFMAKKVQADVTHRYWPQKGDFFVVYEDGYQSISPRKAFLEGYDRI